MRWTFTIPGRLQGMNDMVAAARGNKFVAASRKKREDTLVAYEAKKQEMPKLAIPVHVAVQWIERDARRDLDNVAGGGMKSILDGLVKAEVIPDDSRKWVVGFTHEFPEPDAENPRIIVTLEEVPRG